MTTILTDEQTMLKDAAAEFCAERSPITAFRELRDSQDEAGFSREVWAHMAELGWAGALFPEDVGGFGFGMRGIGLVLEETGKTLVASPLISSVVLSGWLVQLAGNDAQRDEILTAIIGGERLLATAIDERHSHNPSHIETRATESGGGYAISGEKRFVLDGHVADQLIVAARTSGDANDRDGITLFLVDANAAGVTRTRMHMVDSRNTSAITLDNVQVDASAVLGEVGGGFAPLEQALDRARAGLAAEMLGSVMQIFGTTIEYLKTRVQFDVQIGTFQALQHRAAELFGEVEMARSVVSAALNALDEGAENAPLLVSLAKAKLNDTFHHVSNEAIQMHGGIGMTDECDVGFYLKRSRVATETFGNSRFHRDRYAALKGY